MPKIIKTEVFTFEELTNEKSRQKALDWGYDTSTDYEWWDFIYEEAKNLGCEISGFDTGRNNSIDFQFIESAESIAQKIVDEHGEDCETYKTAKSFSTDRDKLVEKYSDGTVLNKVAEDKKGDFDDECDELEEEFCKSLGKDYLKMLQAAWEYLTSEEAIIQTFEANEYTFTKEGKRFG